jgi:hypothetical protein
MTCASGLAALAPTAKGSPAAYCQDYAISVPSALEFEWDEAKHVRTLRANAASVSTMPP